MSDEHDLNRNHAGRGSILVQDAGLSGSEKAVLEIMRYIMLSFATPESQGWIRAFRRGYDFWPETRAAHMAMSVFAMVQSMRCARGSEFRFANPDCKRCVRFLTPDERRFLTVLACVGRGERSRSHAEALILCEGRDPGTTLAAARTLSDLLANDGAIAREWQAARP